MVAAILVAMAIGETPVVVETIPGSGGQIVETETAIGHGIVHPQFKTMQAGASGEARHARLLWAGWAFGMCQILLFVSALALGMRKESGLGPVRIWMVLGGVGFGIVFTLLTFSYRAYMVGEETGIFFGFPVPTAWMVYGVWLFPVFFVVLYMAVFDSWHLSKEDRARFRRLMEANEANPPGGGAGH